LAGASLFPYEGEAAEHEGDPEELPDVHERVRVRPREPRRQGNDKGAAPNPDVGSHPPPASNRIEGSANEKERAEGVERDCPKERVARKRRVGGRSPLCGPRQGAGVHPGQGNRRRRGGRGDYEPAEEQITAASRENQPGRAGTQVCDREDATRQVLRPEEHGAPARVLGNRFGHRRGREQREACRPQGLLPGRPLQEGTKQERAEEPGYKRGGDR
jgi:hypothetical protein